jgi:hypothetical protein
MHLNFTIVAAAFLVLGVAALPQDNKRPDACAKAVSTWRFHAFSNIDVLNRFLPDRPNPLAALRPSQLLNRIVLHFSAKLSHCVLCMCMSSSA